MKQPPIRILATLLLFVVALAVALGVYHLGSHADLRDLVRGGIEGTPKTFSTTFASQFLLNPWFYVVLALVILLERLIPAAPAQGLVTRGLAQDLVWVPLTLLAHSFLLPLHILFLRHLYEHHLSFLTLHQVAEWPWLARIVLAVAVSDFLFWLTHLIRHKISVLWYFHAVHHSQRELNFFTEYRVHPLDDVFLYTIGFVPFFMVEHSFVTIVAVVWIRHWHTRLYHANIRSNFGWLRYILVTPQSHRVHHSIEHRHRDRNFGLTLSIWDHLFGTQYRGYDEYPATGIEDEDFPFEQHGEARLGAVGRLVSQLLYPFQAIARRAAPERGPG